MTATTPPCSVKRPRARPRFGFDLEASADAVIQRLAAELEGADEVDGEVFRRTVLLTMPKTTRKFWTPHLDLQVEERPGGGTRLCACFSPHPQLWTSFIAAQALFAFLAIAAAVYATSLTMLGQSALIPLAAMGACLVGGGLVYGTAYIGQGLGSDEMYELRAFVERALEEQVEPEPSALASLAPGERRPGGLEGDGEGAGTTGDDLDHSLEHLVAGELHPHPMAARSD